jgi:hypothetical protein
MIDSFSVATRMCWAAHRTTTRQEDTAYSLLGLFGVHMPLLYGEGRDAFQRLQHEIVRKSNDQSIFAFSVRRHHLIHSGPHMGVPLHFLFAGDPCWFKDEHIPPLTDKHFRPGTPMILLSSVGIQLDLYIAPVRGSPGFSVAALGCSTVDQALCSPALLLEEVQGSSQTRAFTRGWMVASGKASDELMFRVLAGTGKVEGRSRHGNMQVKQALFLSSSGR